MMKCTLHVKLYTVSPIQTVNAFDTKYIHLLMNLSGCDFTRVSTKDITVNHKKQPLFVKKTQIF